jgi:hypothetical protein
MTIHIITKSTVNQETAEYVVIQDGTTLSITKKGTEVVTNISLSDAGKYTNGIVVHWSGIGEFVLSSTDSLINDKELVGYLNYTKSLDKVVGVMVFNPLNGEGAVVFYAPIEYEGNVVVVDKACSTAEAVDAVFPGILEKRSKARAAKINLLRKIGAHDSLSSLEKQVDLLTSLVVQMAALIPVETRPALAEKMQQLLDAVGTNQNKPDEAVLAKILEFKTHMRETQTEYFVQRGDVA